MSTTVPNPSDIRPLRIEIIAGVEFLPQGKELRLDARLHGLDDDTGLLTINVRKLHFRSHPSFCLEDYLASHLRLRFKDYQSRFTSPVLHDLAMKIRLVMFVFCFFFLQSRLQCMVVRIPFTAHFP